MYIKISERFLTLCIIVILALNSILPGFLGSTFFFNTTRIAAFLLIVLLVFNSRNILHWGIIPVIILYIVFCHNNIYQQLGNIRFTQYSICMGIVLVSAVSDSDWPETFLKVIAGIGFVHAVSTIALRFLPGVYYGVIAPLYPSNYSRLVEWYAEGCMPGLAHHYSFNGIYLTVGLYASVALAMKYFDKYRIKVFIFPLIFMVALLLTGKRAHLFFSLIVLYAFYYLYLSNDKRTRALKMIGIALIVLFIGAVVVLYAPSLSTAFVRLKDSLEDGDVTNNRTYFWALAYMLFLEHPIFGIGWGQFLDYSELMLNYRANVHNNFLQLLCETGVIGFSVYMLWIVFYFIRSIWILVKIRKNNNDVREIVYIAFSFMYQLFFIMYCFTGNPLCEKDTFIPYFLSCAIVNYEYRKVMRNQIHES